MENLESSIALIGALSALGGSIIGSLITLFGTWLKQKSEERKHYKELIVKAAIENWKEDLEVEKTVMENRPELPTAFPSLDQYLIYMTKLSELVIDKNIKADGIDDIFAELEKVDDRIQKYKSKKSNINFR